VLAERIKQRRAVTPGKIKVRYVKFTPEEMAYDVPADTSDFVFVGRGPGNVFTKPRGVRQVALEADVAKVFKSDAAVNNALRKLMEAMPQPAKRRKTG
jgi:hypothetical protein